MKKLIFGDFMMKWVSTSLLDTVAISKCIYYAKPPVMSPNVQKCQKYPRTLSLHNNTFPKIYNLLWFWKSDFQVHFDTKRGSTGSEKPKIHQTYTRISILRFSPFQKYIILGGSFFLIKITTTYTTTHTTHTTTTNTNPHHLLGINTSASHCILSQFCLTLLLTIVSSLS